MDLSQFLPLVPETQNPKIFDPLDARLGNERKDYGVVRGLGFYKLGTYLIAPKAISAIGNSCLISEKKK